MMIFSFIKFRIASFQIVKGQKEDQYSLSKIQGKILPLYISQENHSDHKRFKSWDKPKYKMYSVCL